MKESTIQEINPYIPGIVIISHGCFALELLNSAKMICGEIENAVALALEPGDNIEQYRSKLDELINLFPAGTFVLVDILSGTPFNSLMTVIGEKKLYGITGMNLPVLMEVALMRSTSTLEEIGIIAENAIHASIYNLNKFQDGLLKG